jgi:hypothetical protein
MATVEAFQIDGLTIWFWSNDHEPPHFHAKRRGEWEVKLKFMLGPSDMIEVESWSKKTPPKKVLKELTSRAEKHRVALLKQWQEIRDKEGQQE